jgi:hypothetical protein
VRRIGADQIAYVLTGMPYPASLWQVVAWADYNGVSGQLREIMRNLPAKTYASLRDIVLTIEKQTAAPGESGH